MKTKYRCRLLAVVPIVLLAILGAACSSNLEPELRKLSAKPDTIIVVKDNSDAYLAFSAARISKIEQSKVTIKAGTVISKGSGTASTSDIARELINLRSKANPGGFGATETTITGTSGSITAKNQVLEKDTEVEVKEIVSPKQ